uniref:Uncharacterized protein n=1 Tax=Rhizophora mucronata TaxID=61149 RepID=A0A2P2NNV2_RHIMU
MYMSVAVIGRNCLPVLCGKKEFDTLDEYCLEDQPTMV